MLRLDRMEILGFKSFSDKTEVSFPDGVTAIVGPNGCGKSNIGDALNWVLGEQSPKMLRGKQMADVIFNGCETRKPLGMAEVSLHFSGAEGLPHADNGQVVISRRLFRTGESDYRINGARSRLRDIQELLEQGRVGARSYATIEQGRIDQILNAKPRDRRVIIEDAAGISGYKHRRRLTELKLEATHANLLRVNDIVVEVERQIRSLKRQASKARRYRRLREELRTREQIRFGMKARELEAELERLRELQTRASDAEAECAARLSALEASLASEREALERAEREFHGASERLHALDLYAERAEGEIRTCRERIAEYEGASNRQREEAAGLVANREEVARRGQDHQLAVDRGRGEMRRIDDRLEAARSAWEEAERKRSADRAEIEALRRRQFEAMSHAVELRNRLRSDEELLERQAAHRQRLESERNDCIEQLSSLKNGSTELARRHDEEEERVGRLRAAHPDAEQQVQTARAAHARHAEELAEARAAEESARSRLHTLEDVATRFAGVSDGVRAVLNQGSGLSPVGVVADFIEAGRDVETAAEGYLQAFLPTVILESDSDLQRAHELIRASGAGRTSLISRAQPAGGLAVGTSRNGKGELPRRLARDPRVRGRLRERLTLDSASNGVVQERLGDAVLVDDLAAALDLHRQHPATDYVTSEGDVVYASGVVTTGGGPAAGNGGLLAHSRRIHEARGESEQAASRVAAALERAEAARRELDRLETEERERRQALAEAERQLVQLEMQSNRAAEEAARTERRIRILDDELEGLAAERESVEASRQQRARETERAEARHREVENELSSRNAILSEQEAELKELTEQVGALRVELAAREQRQEADEQEARRLSETVAELQAREEALRSAAVEADRRARETAELLARREQELVEHLHERERLRGRGGEMERAIGERRDKLAAQESERVGLRQELEQLRESTRQAELARTKSEASRTHLDDLCRHELGMSADRAAEAAGERLEGADLETLETEVAGLREKIDRLGPVNMTAIDEFTELEERHEFLTAQRKDLEESMASLRETIRRINRTSRERFQVAFDAIRVSFQEVFQTLFNGGRADLRLEEGDDVLECGIEILVQPPGKRLGLVQLMSGGEKALSAIALLFAVFRFQPSPFCLLDEVDAALDDSNVGRFARLLQEYARQTQFVLVTHNKLSMESANRLYGVTMEEAGVSKVISLELH